MISFYFLILNTYFLKITTKFSKLEEKVEELYINNIPINTISNIIKKPKLSIYNAIYRIKEKKQNKNMKTLDLKKDLK